MTDYIVEVTLLYRIQADNEEQAKAQARVDVDIGDIVSMEVTED